MSVETSVSNGDLIQTPIREVVYGATDGIGAFRQVSTITGVSLELAHSSSVVSGIASTAIPLSLCVTGASCMLVSAIWTIPDSYDALKAVLAELEKAEKELNELEIPLDVSEEAKKALSALKVVVEKKLEEAKIALPIAKLGLVNQILCFTMGAGQAAAGAVDICSPAVANTLHFSPLLTGGAATTAGMAAGIALGAIYVIRGSVMMTKSVKSYCIVSNFEEEFKSKTQQSIEEAVEFMKASVDRGKPYLGRRVDSKCLKEAEGKTDVEKLQAFDKGIFTEKLKHKIGIIIAAAMIIGGILAIVAACLFPGTLPLMIILLISSAFFLSVESVFLTYDSSKIFEWLRNKLYQESPHLTEAIKKSLNDPLGDPI